MPIEGPLKELQIHDVFQLLDLGRKTGVLRVTSELRQNAGVVYFANGGVIAAEIRSTPPRGAASTRLLMTSASTCLSMARPVRTGGSPSRSSDVRRRCLARSCC